MTSRKEIGGVKMLRGRGRGRESHPSFFQAIRFKQCLLCLPCSPGRLLKIGRWAEGARSSTTRWGEGHHQARDRSGAHGTAVCHKQ